MVCPDYRLIRWKIAKLLQHGYPTEKIVKIVKGYCKGGNDAEIRKATTKLQMGCTGCIHYDQQQTSLICRDCKRYYRDMYGA